MRQHLNKWQQLVNDSPTKSITEFDDGDIYYIDTVERNYQGDIIGHKFRPAIAVTGPTLNQHHYLAQFRTPLSKEDQYGSLFLIPLTTTHNDHNPNHAYDVKLANRDTITFKGGTHVMKSTNFKPGHESYIRPNQLYHFSANDLNQLYDYEDRQHEKGQPATLTQAHYLGKVEKSELNLLIDHLVASLAHENADIAAQKNRTGYQPKLDHNDTILKLHIDRSPLLVLKSLQKPARNDLRNYSLQHQKAQTSAPTATTSYSSPSSGPDLDL